MVPKKTIKSTEILQRPNAAKKRNKWKCYGGQKVQKKHKIDGYPVLAFIGFLSKVAKKRVAKKKDKIDGNPTEAKSGQKKDKINGNRLLAFIGI